MMLKLKQGEEQFFELNPIFECDYISVSGIESILILSGICVGTKC